MDRSGDTRAKLLIRTILLVATAGLAFVNGMPLFSPLFDPVLFFVQRLAPGFLGPQLLFHFNSLLISLVTLLLAGIPAAIYERLMGYRDSTPVSLGIWLIATLLLTLPSLMNAAEMD
jgi:hypothetical protein